MIRALGLMYARWRVRRSLDGVWVRGLEHVEAAAARGPVLLVSNHVAWWDGLVAALVDDHLGVDSRTLVAADTVVRVPFLRHFGAIPLGAGPRARAGLRAAREHLSGPGRVVWIYAQGRQRPAAVRPLGFRRGYELLAPTVIPVALDYPFRAVHLPAAAVAFGPPTVAPEPAVEALLGDIRAWADGEPLEFVPLVQSRVRAIDRGLGTRLLVGET